MPTPGPVRLMLELDLGIVAAIAAWYVWPRSAAILATLLVVLVPITGWRRARWLMQGAPPIVAG